MPTRIMYGLPVSSCQQLFILTCKRLPFCVMTASSTFIKLPPCVSLMASILASILALAEELRSGLFLLSCKLLISSAMAASFKASPRNTRRSGLSCMGRRASSEGGNLFAWCVTSLLLLITAAGSFFSEFGKGNSKHISNSVFTAGFRFIIGCGGCGWLSFFCIR